MLKTQEKTHGIIQTKPLEKKSLSPRLLSPRLRASDTTTTTTTNTTTNWLDPDSKWLSVTNQVANQLAESGLPIVIYEFAHHLYNQLVAGAKHLYLFGIWIVTDDPLLSR